MNETSDVERAHGVGRRRARIFAVQAILFVTWQGLYFSGTAEEPLRAVSTMKLSAWFVWALALLLMLASGGGLVRHRRLRGLLNDELTRQNRARAYAAGFWAAASACILLYLVGMLEPVSGREAIHIVLSAAVGAALLTFAILERRTAGSG
jgi:predicted lysophospholipase L1 biosynthesis ABC-type transport system permease subunit